MGLYDEFVGACPHCDGEFYSQTKLTDCEMKEYRVGDVVDLVDQRVQLKAPCSVCEMPVVAVIAGQRVVAFEKDGAQIKECAFGSTEVVRPMIVGVHALASKLQPFTVKHG